MNDQPGRPQGLTFEDTPDEPPEHPEGSSEEGPPGIDRAAFGLWLRRQREMRSISLREIADASKISFRYLEALEDERFDLLPAPVFARGFLRQYARYVGLDADEVVNYFLQAQGREPDEASSSSAPVAASANNWTTGLVLAILVVGFLGIVFLLSYQAREREQIRSEPPPIVAPIPEPTAPRAPAPTEIESSPAVASEPLLAREPDEEGPDEAEIEQAAPPLLLVLDFLQDCWVEAKSDENATTSQLYVQGESLRLEAQKRIQIKLGRADGVRAELNGTPIPVESSPGSDVARLDIDLEDAAAMRARDRPPENLP